MLARFMQTEYIPAPRIEKRCGGEDVSALGAFEWGSVIEITARIPRRLGVTSAEICIRRDTLAPCDEGKDSSVQRFGQTLKLLLTPIILINTLPGTQQVRDMET